MKYVGSMLGAAAARTSVEAPLPSKGVLQRDLIPFVAERYQFNVSPPSGPGVGPLPFLTFMSGVFNSDDDRIPIIQTIFFPDGLVVLTRETEYADVVLDDLMAGLDSTFGYHYRAVQVERLHLSQITVELDSLFVQQVAAFQTIQALVNGALHRMPGDYRLKRLTFADNAHPDLPSGVPNVQMDQVMLRDFVMERRAGEPIEKNLFFCSAPMATKDHIAVLENIENACLNQQ